MKGVNHQIVAGLNAKLFVLQEKMSKDNSLPFFKELEFLVRKYEGGIDIFYFKDLMDFINEINCISLPGSLGRFNLCVLSDEGTFEYSSLKTNASLNPECFGFGLNHYPFPGDKSTYFDGENVDISIYRSDFISAKRYKKTLIINLNKSTVQVSW